MQQHSYSRNLPLYSQIILASFFEVIKIQYRDNLCSGLILVIFQGFLSPFWLKLN